MFALIRHAEYNIRSGSLTESSEAAVLSLARHLKEYSQGWNEVRASPSPRTHETAAIIAHFLNISLYDDPRISMDGNYVDLLPPTEPQNIIFISHLPVITQMLRTWSRYFQQEEPPLTQLTSGYIVEPETKKILLITTEQPPLPPPS